MVSLLEQHCKRDAGLLDDTEIQDHLDSLEYWQCSADNKSITRTFTLGNYDETLTLVKIITDIAIEQDHHPDICFGYRECTVQYTTHSVGGLSLNDFICAASIEHAQSR